MQNKENINELKEGLISIIIPVYNTGHYLVQAVLSVLNQDYKNIEVILIDDGSTDGSGDVCDEFAKSDLRIKVIHQNNLGPSEARNRGLKISTGEFVFFLDSDDFLEEESFSSLMNVYEQNQADLIAGDFRKINNQGEEKRRDIPFDIDQNFDQLAITEQVRLYLKKPNKYLLFAFSWGRLFKNSTIKNHNIFFHNELSTFEDVAFNFEYLRYAKKLYFLKKVVCNHRVYNDNSSATVNIGNDPKKIFGYTRALRSAYDYLAGFENGLSFEKEVGHAYVTLTIIQLVRLCGQINKNNKKIIFKFIKELMNDETLKKSFKYYTPAKGESTAIPFFLKVKMVRPIVWVCKYKNYKKLKNIKVS